MSAHVDFLSVLDEPRHLEQVNLCAPKAKLDLAPGVIDEENDFATNVEADTHAGVNLTQPASWKPGAVQCE